VIRRLEWVPPGGRRIAQLQIYRIEGGQAFVATATTRSESFEGVESELRNLLAGLLVERTRGPSLPPVQEETVRDEPMAKFERGEATASGASPEPAEADWGSCVDAWKAVHARFSDS
jgi:hypothetical protein